MVKERIASHPADEQTFKETPPIAKHPQDKRPMRMPTDSRLAVFRDRVTYTFIIDGEVASIHFDRRRGEIFYKGHNIANMELAEAQRRLLKGFIGVLMADPQGEPFMVEYTATLNRLLADK